LVGYKLMTTNKKNKIEKSEWVWKRRIKNNLKRYKYKYRMN
jgi:hypothetical protein